VKNTSGTTTYLDLSYSYTKGNSYGTDTTHKTGQMTKIVDNIDHNRDKLYEFDALGRILNAKAGTSAGASGVTANWTQSYSYDRYGNKYGVSATGHDQNSVTMPTDGLLSATADASTNRLNVSTWTYDLAGNLIRGQDASGTWQKFEYDAAGRLVKVKDDSNNVLETYTYGASRERLMTETSSQRTYYAWGGQSVIAEYTETSTTPNYDKSYIFAGSRLLMTATKASSTTETQEFHHPNRLGTELVTDGAAGTSYRQTTLPFGTSISAETTGNSNRVFTSYDRSFTTGLDYAVNRTYSAGQGRFTQVDPLKMGAANATDPQSLNLYSYVQNMPTDFTDPSGLNMTPFFYPTNCRVVGEARDGSAIYACDIGIHWMDIPDPIGNGGINGGGGRAISNRSTIASYAKKTCSELATLIRAVRDELAKRGADLVKDLLNLPPGPGPMTIAGHTQKFRERQGSLRKALSEFLTQGCGGPGPTNSIPGDAWEWATDPTPKKRGIPDSSQSSRMLEIGGGVVVTAATAYVVYRVVRMLPSLAPPLWPSIPANLAIP